MTHHQAVCSRHIAEIAPGEATTEDHPNPRLRKGFKPRNTRNTRKNGTLPRISRIPRSSRLSILTDINPGKNARTNDQSCKVFEPRYLGCYVLGRALALPS